MAERKVMEAPRKGPKKVKVECLIDKVWLDEGFLVKDEIRRVDPDLARQLVEKKQVIQIG